MAISQVITIHSNIIIAVLVAHTPIAVELAALKEALLNLVVLGYYAHDAVFGGGARGELAAGLVRFTVYFLKFNIVSRSLQGWLLAKHENVFECEWL